MDSTNLAAYIRDVPDFPVHGVLFRDITTLVKDAAAFRTVIDRFVAHFRDQQLHKIVGIEARGFIFAAPLAYELGVGFVPVRKTGKLPAEKLSQSYELEYGAATLEIHVDALEKGERVAIVDDVLATGGSSSATAKLIERLGGVVVGVAFVGELTFLHGREKLDGYDVLSLIQY